MSSALQADSLPPSHQASLGLQTTGPSFFIVDKKILWTEERQIHFQEKLYLKFNMQIFLALGSHSYYPQTFDQVCYAKQL